MSIKSKLLATAIAVVGIISAGTAAHAGLCEKTYGRQNRNAYIMTPAEIASCMRTYDRVEPYMHLPVGEGPDHQEEMSELADCLGVGTFVYMSDVPDKYKDRLKEQATPEPDPVGFAKYCKSRNKN